MRFTLIAALVVGTTGAAGAQDTTITIRPGGRHADEQLVVRQLPRDVADEIVRFFNGPGTLHFSGITRVPAGRGIDGDVAILGGPVTVAGRISGGLVVVNGDVVFERGAVVGGDVTVVGGTVSGTDDADIDGEIRVYRDPLRYRRTGDEIVYAPQREIPPRWSRIRRQISDGRGSTSGFVLSMGGTYNRVEGAPIVFGPRLDTRLNDGMRFQADVRGIFRTGRDISFQGQDFGYRARGELVFGGRYSNVGFGARGYDVMASVETWPLKDYEAGWAAFLLHSDYRDFYRRHGGALYTTLRIGRPFAFTVEGRDETQSSVEARDPWTLFRGDRAWRENPAVTDGRYRSAVASFRFDTRNDRGAPSSGVFVTGEYEVGEGKDVTGTTDPTLVCITTPCVPPELSDGKLTYQRVFFDARSYLRVSPSGRLNLRVAGGGRVGGEALPLQHRFSLGYPDPLSGYGVRQFSCGGELVAGGPALCDRVLVGQAEFRTHLGFDFGPEWANDWGEDDNDRYEPFHVTGPDVVVFADAGRAWMAGRGLNKTPLDRLPALSTFKSDIGVGLDLGPIGFYFAKALDQAERPVSFTVRMGRRF
ncbi:MAG: BamA/TamA family outer membrane protein [Gemmatimonadota bacterium]